ncbi:MAG: thioredoxin domain-containing protein [bacterium]
MNNLKSPINPNQLTPLAIIAIVVAIIFAGLLAVLVINILAMSQRISESELAINQYQQVELKDQMADTYTPEIAAIIEGENSPWFGSPSAKIVIVEFADFACPYCNQAYPTIRQIGIKYQDKVKIIFRNRPGFEDSIALAMAAHCADDQGKFWAMHDQLYEKYSPELAADVNNLVTIAQQIGLDVDELTKCITDQKYLDKIENDFVDAQSLGVLGTPTWFVNGQKMEGVVTLAEWESIINQLID